MHNRESFLAYFLKHGGFGIKINGKLMRCYQGMSADVDWLISEGWARVIETQDSNKRTEGKKKKIIFPLDKADADVEISIPLNCNKYLAGLWNDKIGDNANIKWEQILQ